MAPPKSPENEILVAIVVFYLLLTAVLFAIHYIHRAAGAPAAPVAAAA